MTNATRLNLDPHVAWPRVWNITFDKLKRAVCPGACAARMRGIVITGF
jgi:hypothetical protein